MQVIYRSAGWTLGRLKGWAPMLEDISIVVDVFGVFSLQSCSISIHQQKRRGGGLKAPFELQQMIFVPGEATKG